MFAELLKQVMTEKAMNLTAVSAATGIGKSSISQYLSGKVEPPDKRKAAIAVALNLPVDYFKKAVIKDDSTAPEGSLNPKTVAKLMGKSKEFIYQGLRDGVFPWGFAVKMGSKWSYWISKKKFVEYTGIDIA